MSRSSEHAWEDGGEAVRGALGTHPEIATEVLRALPGVTDPGGLASYLERVVDAAQKHVPGCDAAGVTVVIDGEPATAAYTDHKTLRVDGDQYAAGDGPCLDAYRRRVVNLVDVEEAHERWPAFASAAATDGILSFLGLPLVSQGTAFGALNLYAHHPEAFDTASVGLARLLAERAADAIAAAQTAQGAELVALQLREAMSHRAVIEQAKGALMLLRRVDADAAFELLSQESQRRNVKLRQVAQELVERLSAQAADGPAADAGGQAAAPDRGRPA